jgi:O-antigen ligase
MLLFISDLHPLFIDSFENSFHGFAGGRIEYGLWTTVAILLSITYRTSINKQLLRATQILMFTGLFLSQSRSSFVALAGCLIYIINAKYRNNFFKLSIFSLIFIALIGALLSWEFFGRQNVFELLNSTRLEIYSIYFNQISVENIFFGSGGQNSISLENGVVTQAHNLFLQWLSNWGLFGLFSLILFLYLFLKSLESIYSRMLFLSFIFYSSIQPIQGTANFFGPVTLLIFLIIMGIEYDKINNKTIAV